MKDNLDGTEAIRTLPNNTPPDVVPLLAPTSVAEWRLHQSQLPPHPEALTIPQASKPTRERSIDYVRIFGSPQLRVYKLDGEVLPMRRHGVHFRLTCVTVLVTGSFLGHLYFGNFSITSTHRSVCPHDRDSFESNYCTFNSNKRTMSRFNTSTQRSQSQTYLRNVYGAYCTCRVLAP
jgi:hypothetical protein